MYNDPGRRQVNGNADARARRRIPVDAHVGGPQEFRARLVRAAREAALHLTECEYLDKLERWSTDERLLRWCFDHLSAYGGQSPGVDGMRYTDIPETAVYAHMRTIRDAVRNDEYEPGDLLRVEKPRRGREPRILELPIIYDRVLGRAVLEAVGPYLDPRFDPRSFGFRPGRDRWSALALALDIARRENRWVWAPADVQNAFPSVPRKRLIDIVLNRLPNERMGMLISELTGGTRPRGIYQGQPLSPLLLNLYLDHLLDQVWRRLHGDIPLLRVADDLLLLCRTTTEADEGLASLREILQPAGMQLKGNPEEAVADARLGSVDWLGVTIRARDSNPKLSLPEPAWEKLGDLLARCHEFEMAPVRAWESIQGWCRQQGPALLNDQLSLHLGRLRSMAAEAGFLETPTDVELFEAMRQVRHRWPRQLSQAGDRERKDEVLSGLACGSAAARSGFQGFSRPVLSTGMGPLEPVWTVYTDGCSLGAKAPGGWAFYARENCGRCHVKSGGLARATNNQAELAAAIHALQELPYGANVVLYTDSQYLANGINGLLERWHDEGRLFPLGGYAAQLSNRELWQELSRELIRVNCEARHIPGHAGDELNQLCDALAKQAAHEELSRGTHVREEDDL